MTTTGAELSTEKIARVAELLGRAPRGLEEIAVSDSGGDPIVIRVASLVDGEPFPTLYWLVGERQNCLIDQLEAGGLIAELQAEVDSDRELQECLELDHRRHIERRNGLMTAQVRAELIRKGYFDALAQRGIGGIANFTRIRCLHTWFAAHCVERNTIGGLLELRCPGLLEKMPAI